MNTIRNPFVMWVCGLYLATTGSLANVVTVNPGSGGDYETLKQAVDGFFNWKTGTDNSIVLVDGPHLIDQGITISGLSGETLTIRAADGTDPVIIGGEAVEEMIRIENGAMTMIFTIAMPLTPVSMMVIPARVMSTICRTL